MPVDPHKHTLAGMVVVDYDDIVQARKRISPYLIATPLEPAPGLHPSAWLKLENANPMHSFKIRGAMNAVLSLDRAERQRGIITASSGNHAQGIAYAASLAGVRARILMPPTTPRRKVMGVQRFGAEAVLYGPTYDDAELEARRLEREHGYTFISPYNDARVIAGAGTIGLEIMDRLPEVERVLISVGGGGLVSGIATAIKAVKPSVEIIGVCAQSAPAMYNHFYGKQLPQVWETLAEALSGEIENGSLTLEIARLLVDDVVLVTEAQIIAAMRWLLYEQGWLVEGGGAVTVAAALNHVVELDTRPSVMVVSGGNLDYETIQEVLS